MDYSNLTISKYQRINQIAKSDKEELDKQLEVVSILTGMSVDHLSTKVSLPKLKELFTEASFLYKQEFNSKVNSIVWIKGKPYRGLTKVEQLNAGQYIDLKKFGGKDFVGNLHNLLAIIYKPVWGKYSHISVANAMLNAKLYDVAGLVFFYSRVLEKLSPTIQMCSALAILDIQEEMEIMKKELEAL